MTNGAANYTEELVMALVTTQLTIMSIPFLNVQIVPFSSNFENIFGADTKIPGSARIAPFYMQFKRPIRSTPTGKISKTRGALNLTCINDSLHFNLRKKLQKKNDPAPPVRKLQHNVLFRMRERLIQRRIGDAAYVCSLFLDSGTYVRKTHLYGFMRLPMFLFYGPYDRKNIVISDVAGSKAAFNKIPWLAGHISIPPHAEVGSADHAYSFDHSGADICFHSPLHLEGGGQELRDWVVQMAERLRLNDLPTLENSGALLSELISDTDSDAVKSSNNDNLREWLSFGDRLYEEHGITQFAFVMNSGHSFEPIPTRDAA